MGIWNNIVNGYKDTEEYSFFKRVKDTWKKANSEQRKEMILKTAKKTALLVGSFVAGGMIGGVGGVVAVAVGWGAYGTHQEYKARKQAGLSKAVRDNGGRPLTKQERTRVRNKALVDTFGMASFGMAAVEAAKDFKPEDVKTAGDKAKKKVANRYKKLVASLGLGNAGLISAVEPDIKAPEANTAKKENESKNKGVEPSKKIESKAFDFKQFRRDFKGPEL